MKRSKLIATFYLLAIIIHPSIAASEFSCNGNPINVNRNDSSFSLIFYGDSATSSLNLPTANYMQVTQSPFLSSFTGVTSCSVTAQQLNLSTIYSETMTCSLTGTTLKLSPWKKLPGSINAIYKLTVLINLTPNFEAVTPANYIFTSTVFNASNVSLFTSCGQTMEFQYSTAATFTMQLPVTPVSVMSLGRLEFTYKPSLSTPADSLEIRFYKTDFALNFLDAKVILPFSSTTSSSNCIINDSLSNTISPNTVSNTCSSSTFYCLLLTFSTIQTFIPSTTYTVKLTQFQFPFHPLGLPKSQINLYQNSFLEEQGISTTQITSSQFTQYSTTSSGFTNYKFCSAGGSCTSSCQVGVSYSFVEIKIKNTLNIISASQITLSIPTDLLTIPNGSAVTLEGVAGSQLTSGGNTVFTFTNSITLDIDNGSTLTFNLSTPTCGLSSSNYPIIFSSSSLSTSSTYTETISGITLNANTFGTMTVQTPNLQIGAVSTYLIKFIPQQTFTNTNFFQIVFTFTGMSLITTSYDASCHDVILYSSTGQISLSIGTVTRIASSLTLSGTLSSQILVQYFTVSICQITNPSTIGNSSSISASANYASSSFVSESGITNPTIVAGNFLSGSTVVLKDSSLKITEQSNGCIITLLLPVTSVSGDIIIINFPYYFKNFVYDPASSSSVTELTFSKVARSLSWNGTVNGALTTITLGFLGQNPPTTSNTFTFIATLTTNASVQKLTSNINFSSNTLTPITANSITFTRDSAVNGALTNYYFKYTQPFYVMTNLFIRIESISTSLSGITGVTDTNNILTGISYTITSSTYLDITGTISESNNISSKELFIKVTGWRNYYSALPVSIPFIAGESEIKQGMTTIVNISNNNSKTLSPTSTSVTNVNPQFFDTDASFSFTINFGLQIPNNGIVEITSSLALGATVTASSTNLSFKSVNVGTNTIALKCTSGCTSETITISYLHNPTYTNFVNTVFSILSEVKTYEVDSATQTIQYIMEKISFSTTDLPLTFSCYPSGQTSYCKSCSLSPLTCLGCYSDAIFSSTKFNYLDTTASPKKCVNSCPSNSYVDASNNCIACDSKCTACSGSSTNCSACISTLFLQGNACNAQCNSDHFDSNGVCFQCDLTKCLTCKTTSTNCLTCSGGLGLIIVNGLGKCVDCSNTSGYFGLPVLGKCQACDSLCTACQNSSTNCQSCISTAMHNSLTFTCKTTCESTYSPLQDASNKWYCGKCTSPCLTCNQDPKTCSDCETSYFLQGIGCILQNAIPVGYYGNLTTRRVTACNSECSACVSQTLCTTCISSYFIYKGECLSSCPTDTVADGSGGCKVSAESLVTNIDDYQVVPFPMVLASIVFGISVYFSKYDNQITFVPACIVGFGSIFEYVTWCELIGSSITSNMSVPLALSLIAMVLLYLVNILYFLRMRAFMETDPLFIEWRHQCHKNELCFKIIKYSALVTSFKAQKVIFSRYFNQSFFKARLESIDVFSTFNKLSLFSVVFSSSFIILGSGIIMNKTNRSSQEFFLGLDSLIVTLLMFIFMIWEALKKDTFFEEQNSAIEKQSQKFFPFDSSYTNKLLRRNKSSISGGESNSSLPEFREDKKVTVQEDVQKPLNDVLDPSEISPNARIDPNILKNSQSGAPYLIQDQISESSAPNGKRSFQKKHLAPEFDLSKYDPIYEHSQEDDDDDDYDNADYDEEARLRKSQGRRLDQSVGMGNNRSNIQNRSMSQAQYGEDEPLPPKPGQNRTVYYGEGNQQIGKSGIQTSALAEKQAEIGVSLGVVINDGKEDQDDDEEGREVRDKLYSKPGDQGYELQNVKKSKTEDTLRSKKSKNNSPNQSPSGKNKTVNQRSKSPKQSGEGTQNEEGYISGPGSKRSKKGGKNKPQLDGDSLFYFAHPMNEEQNDQTPTPLVEIQDKNNQPIQKPEEYFDSPKNISQNEKNKQPLHPQFENNSSQKQNPQNSKSNPNKNVVDDDTKVERIRPVIEDLDGSDMQDDAADMDDPRFSMKMKGPFNERNRPITLVGEEPDSESPNKNKYIFDSSESVHTAEEAEMNYNEISPSDFNVLNQRYEEDYFAMQMNQQMQQQGSQQNPSYLQQQIPLQQTANQMNLPYRSQVNPQNFESGMPFNQFSQQDGLGQASDSIQSQQGKKSKKKPKTRKNASSIPRGRGNSNVGSRVQLQNVVTPSATSVGREQRNDQIDPLFRTNQFRTNDQINEFDDQGRQDGMNKSNSKGLRVSVSPHSASNQVISYKMPQTDTNKLRSLEKIYLQRLEGLSQTTKNASKVPSARKTRKQGSQLSDLEQQNNQNNISSDKNSQLLMRMNPNSFEIDDFGEEQM